MQDRPNLSVDQEAFMVAVSKGISSTKTPGAVVTLTMTPGAVVMPWLEHTGAALNIFLAGTYTGTAFASVLFGETNPSAKSPVTFPITEFGTVFPCKETDCHYKEGLFVGWTAFEGKPVNFPFGHGLSFTTFGYSELIVSIFKHKSKRCDGASVCVYALVKNTGKVKGVEVAQLYLGIPDAGEPLKLLRGFERLPELEPGHVAAVVFPLHARDLQVYDALKKTWHAADGLYRVYVGSSSRDIRLAEKFVLCGGHPNGTMQHKLNCKL
mmetsp:Transcript_33028/g.108468  ORF Transcript_33028/g.108468 Transcript_33028/m.108468 type:complete len:267 (+) Transcript_33028:811-1611(+)